MRALSTLYTYRGSSLNQVEIKVVLSEGATEFTVQSNLTFQLLHSG